MPHMSKPNMKIGWQMVEFRDREAPKCQVGTGSKEKQQRPVKQRKIMKERTIDMYEWHLTSRYHVFDKFEWNAIMESPGSSNPAKGTKG